MPRPKIAKPAWTPGGVRLLPLDPVLATRMLAAYGFKATAISAAKTSLVIGAATRSGMAFTFTITTGHCAAYAGAGWTGAYQQGDRLAYLQGHDWIVVLAQLLARL